jgi:hypothetical protein
MLINTFITRRHIIAACIIAPSFDIRHYLNGLLVELTPECAFVVATDGHRCAAFRDDDGASPIYTVNGPQEFIIPLALASSFGTVALLSD